MAVEETASHGAPLSPATSIAQPARKHGLLISREVWMLLVP